jgi:DnaJ-class molecular chaperone
MAPHSFVLADLFDVASMSQAPDHLLEDEPGLVWETCPHCEGEGWVEGDKPSAWATPYALQFFPDACKTIRPCPRCKGRRDVLGDENESPTVGDSFGLAKNTHACVFEAAA